MLCRDVVSIFKKKLKNRNALMLLKSISLAWIKKPEQLEFKTTRKGSCVKMGEFKGRKQIQMMNFINSNRIGTTNRHGLRETTTTSSRGQENTGENNQGQGRQQDTGELDKEGNEWNMRRRKDKNSK